MDNATATAGPVPYKRKLRNYLLDARFQLKFASYIVAVTLVVAGLLFVFLWKTTASLFGQVDQAVEARSKTAETSRELGMCALNNEVMKNMDNPEFDKEMAKKSAAIDQAYEVEKQNVIAAKLELEKEQRLTLYALVGGLLAFIAAVGLGTIVTTHRIVGPLFRIKRMAAEVASGKVQPPTYGLRPGDELHDVFAAFEAMVTRLRERSNAEAKQLEEALVLAGSDPAKLKALLERMKADVDARLAMK